MGDFTGFSFDGISSDSLGIMRVSDGDRYKEELQPEIRDITAEVPGVHGEYYFGSTYGTKEFEIEIAYDYITEQQFRKLKQIFSGSGIHELIFDEHPYKKYLVKLSSPIELSFVCFDERMRYLGASRNGVRRNRIEDTPGEPKWEQVIPYEYSDYTGRIYKGEGTISLVAYYPFAKSVFRELPTSSMYPNVNDWASSSGLLDETTRERYIIDSIITTETPIGSTNLTYVIPTGFDAIIPVYNSGDIPVKPMIYIPFNSSSGEVVSYDIDLKLSTNDEVIIIKDLIPIHNENIPETGFIVNMNNGLIEGVNIYTTDGINKTWVTSGNLYNQFIEAGHFFSIPPTDWNNESLPLYVAIKGRNINIDAIDINYDYLYL